MEKQTPEEELLSSFLFDDVQLVVVPQRTGHFLIGHVVSVLLSKITQHGVQRHSAIRPVIVVVS